MIMSDDDHHGWCLIEDILIDNNWMKRIKTDNHGWLIDDDLNWWSWIIKLADHWGWIYWWTWLMRTADNGWINGLIDGLIDRLIDGLIDGWIDRLMDESIDWYACPNFSGQWSSRQLFEGIFSLQGCFLSVALGALWYHLPPGLLYVIRASVH